MCTNIRLSDGGKTRKRDKTETCKCRGNLEARSILEQIISSLRKCLTINLNRIDNRTNIAMMRIRDVRCTIIAKLVTHSIVYKKHPIRNIV